MDRARECPDNVIEFLCPGCNFVHRIRYGDPSSSWTWNGSLEFPTFEPSVLMQRKMGNNRYQDDPLFEWRHEVCHSFVREGKIQFLSDSTHSLSGQTVELPEWPYGKEDG